MAKSSTAKLAERLAVVAVVVVLVAWAVLTYLGSDDEAPEVEVPQAEQDQTDADAGPEPTTDAVEADEPESDDGQAIAEPEAVPEQPGAAETGQEEAEQPQAPGADAEPAADAASDADAPEAEAPQAEQDQTDAGAGSDPAAEAVEAEEPEAGDGQAAAEPEAVPEQPGAAETGQEEAEQQQAAGAAAEPEAPQAEQGQTDADTGSEPAADEAEAEEPEAGDGQAAAEPEAVPEQPGTAESGQEEAEQQPAPGAGAEPAAAAAAEPEATAPELETGAEAAEDRSGLDSGASAGADAADVAAEPSPATPQASGQDQTHGVADELGTGSSDAVAAQPAQGQAGPTDGEDAATAALPADDAAAPETAELAAAAETVQADEAPGTGGATISEGASPEPDAAAASPSQEIPQEGQAEQTASGVAAGSGGTPASEIPDSGTARADEASGQDGTQDEAASTEEIELAMLDDGVGQQAADEPAPDAESAPAAITIPTFDVVRVDAFGTTVIAGRAAPGDRVDAVVNSVVAATETASSTGEFVMLFELDPQSGPLEIALMATGPGGPVRSAETVVVFDPASAADESPSAAADPAVLIALEDRVELLQPAIPPAQAESPASELAIESISSGEEGDPTVVAGRGAADGQVRILVDGRPVMTEQISESGAWSADLEVPDAARHALRVEELDEAGNVVASVETPFERAFDDGPDPERSASQDAAQSGISELDGSASVEIVTVEPGFTLWGISRKYYGKGRLYVRIYHSNLQQIEDPDLIFPGQQFVVPAFETAPPRRPD